MIKNAFETKGRREGFKGQKAIVLPNKILKSCKESPLVKQLFITDIGFYPNAKYHYCKRANGISQHILIYCVGGKGWLEAEGRFYEVYSGQYIIIPSNKPHRYGSDEKNPWTIYWLHFKGYSAADFALQLSKLGTRFVASANFHEERIRVFNSMYTTLENGYSADNLGYINSCLWYFLSSFCYDNTFHTPFNKSNEKDAIDLSIEYMQQHIHRVLTIQELAGEAHISPSHYAALFKKKTGYPPLEYFNHIKIQKACQFLHFSSLKIKEISYKIGIDDPYYFSRFFSNIMGMSPLQYRNSKH